VSWIGQSAGTGFIFNLTGDLITQQQLTDFLNAAFETDLVYEELTPEEYLKIQQGLNGEFLGTVIYGIYYKIRNGEFSIESDYEYAAGRPHISWPDYFTSLK